MALTARQQRRGGGATNTRRGSSAKQVPAPRSGSGSARPTGKSSSRPQVHDVDTSQAEHLLGAAHPTFNFDSAIDKKTKMTEYKGPAVDVADVYSNKTIIKPQWMRVSATPWVGAKKATGGYGRRIDDT